MIKIPVLIKKLKESAILPKYAHGNGQDAGMDVCACEDGVIEPGKSNVIGIGWAMEVPIGYEIQVRPRSGLAFKYMVTVLNSPGTLDSIYRGEIGVILINHGSVPFEYKAGDRIAQIVFGKIEVAQLREVDELSETERGTGGFGSTGIR